MPRPIDELKKERLKKLKKIRDLGFDIYPSKFERKHTLQEAREKNVGSVVSSAGRIMGWREHGQIVFADLLDETSNIQLAFRDENLDSKKRKLVSLLDIGDFVGVEGKTFETKTGELTIEVSDVFLLSKSLRPLPNIKEEFKDKEERYRQRYVDLLLNPEVREVFEKRAQVVQFLRSYLDERGFMEVKTPALQTIYGGATAKPFITHHNALDIDLYLRISDELYLKRLIVGGFEKVYEIATDFRNEGIDRWHNPEFTMLEFYQAYSDYEDLMDMTQDMLSKTVKEIASSFTISYGDKKINFKPPWKRISYRQVLLDEVGVDIDKVGDLKSLKKALKEGGVAVDLKGVKDLAEALDALYKQKVRDKLINPTFLIDHPYFMRPLAKKKKSDPSKVESFQLVSAGAELINAYSELNDPLEQKRRWEEELERASEGVGEYQVIDEDYIRALEYGMPPTAGWGLGIERFVALLTNQHSLKDTILFPTLKPEK